MAKIKYTLVLFLLLAGEARADEWDFAVEINGKSNHQASKCNNGPCNEENNGFGLEFRNYATWPTILAAGEFKNSFNHDSWYVGAGKTFRFGEKYGVEAGVFASYISYDAERENHKFFAIVPLIIIDLNYARINTIYIPSYKKNQDEIKALWFFQLVIPIR